MKRQRMFNLIVKTSEMVEAKNLVASTIGVSLKGQMLFHTGIMVKSFNHLPCVYYPFKQKIHVAQLNSFGYFLTKDEYRKEISNLL
jgi:hypothetical protein